MEAYGEVSHNIIVNTDYNLTPTTEGIYQMRNTCIKSYEKLTRLSRRICYIGVLA